MIKKNCLAFLENYVVAVEEYIDVIMESQVLSPCCPSSKEIHCALIKIFHYVLGVL